MGNRKQQPHVKSKNKAQHWWEKEFARTNNLIFFFVSPLAPHTCITQQHLSTEQEEKTRRSDVFLEQSSCITMPKWKKEQKQETADKNSIMCYTCVCVYIYIFIYVYIVFHKMMWSTMSDDTFPAHARTRFHQVSTWTVLFPRHPIETAQDTDRRMHRA